MDVLSSRLLVSATSARNVPTSTFAAHAWTMSKVEPFCTHRTTQHVLTMVRPCLSSSLISFFEFRNRCKAARIFVTFRSLSTASLVPFAQRKMREGCRRRSSGFDSAVPYAHRFICAAAVTSSVAMTSRIHESRPLLRPQTRVRTVFLMKRGRRARVFPNKGPDTARTEHGQSHRTWWRGCCTGKRSCGWVRK